MTTPSVSYKTKLGKAFNAPVEEFLDSRSGKLTRGKVQLLFTSPPFPLLRKKSYGNKTGIKYLEWLRDLAPKFKDLLTDDGSIVIEIGNAWESGKPVMSTLPNESLLEFLKAADLNLCQQFICHNPARLPSPIQWVNRERIRVKDSFTQVWWMSPSERPKANNREVLVPYSDSMKKLIKRGSYNSGDRPSEHSIGETSFNRDNGGAIPPSVLEIANTNSRSPYRNYCKAEGITPHPAQMPEKLAEFFINFLTEPGDLIFDPFAGSNTTGAVAESLERKWIATEPKEEYLEGSKGRFPEFAPEHHPTVLKLPLNKTA